MTQKNKIVATPCPDLLEDKPYSRDHGSVFMELVECASWDYVLMGQERGMLYDYCKNRWEEIRDEAKHLLQNTFYNGTGKYSLDSHTTFQKTQLSNLESCKEHVNTTCCNEESKVSLLLSTSNCNDQCFVTQKETVKEDLTYKKDYNKASNYLLVACPVKKQNKGSKEQVCSKSQVAATNINIKSGRGPKIGVDLQWYPSKSRIYQVEK